MAKFSDLELGDVFSFNNLVGHESWEKIGPNTARLVNSTRQEDVRNVGSDEPVTVTHAMADRRARLRELEKEESR